MATTKKVEIGWSFGPGMVQDTKTAKKMGKSTLKTLPTSASAAGDFSKTWYAPWLLKVCKCIGDIIMQHGENRTTRSQELCSSPTSHVVRGVDSLEEITIIAVRGDAGNDYTNDGQHMGTMAKW